MANRRMISKSISTSRKLARVSDFAALLFTWLIPHCDDGGNMDGEPELIKAIVFPIRPEQPSDIRKALSELVRAGLVQRYGSRLTPLKHHPSSRSATYLHIINFEQHQTLRGDRPDFRYPSHFLSDGETTGKPLVNQTATTGKLNLTKQNLTEREGKRGNQRLPAHSPPIKV